MLKSIALPASIEEIGNQAFYSSGVSEITLPEGLKSIGESAFG
jgi:ubiquinone biosynthesis protein COQ9